MIPRFYTFAVLLLTMGVISPVFAEEAISVTWKGDRIGQGDTVEIVVWAGQKKEESLSGEYFVFASGVIEILSLGALVSGQKRLRSPLNIRLSHSQSPCQAAGTYGSQ